LGLGPPVCVDCGIIGALFPEGWRCPNCNSFGSLKSHLWMYSKDEQIDIETCTKIMEENRGQLSPE